MTNPANSLQPPPGSPCQLALETIGRGGSIALLSPQQVFWVQAVGTHQRAAADLAVKLDDALSYLRQYSVTPNFVSVAIGPGSFTGLRVGVTTAKTLAYALDLPIVPVGSLGAIALAASRTTNCARVLVGLNAYRQQIFTAEFERNDFDHSFERWNDRAKIVSREEWENLVARADDRALVVGEASISCDRFDITLEADPNFLPATGVGWAAWKMTDEMSDLGFHRAEAGPFVDAFALAPRYIKASAAEEKRAES